MHSLIEAIEHIERKKHLDTFQKCVKCGKTANYFVNEKGVPFRFSSPFVKVDEGYEHRVCAPNA